MAVTKTLRFEILRRDNFTCTYCGASAPKVTLHVEHIIPDALGGPDTPANLTTACIDCNLGKSVRMLDENTIEQANLRAAQWKDAIEQAITENRERREEDRLAGEYFLGIWLNWTPHQELDPDYPRSVARFLDLGLDWDDIEELVKVAMLHPAKETWKYFCGCCLRRIQQLQERAHDIMEGF